MPDQLVALLASAGIEHASADAEDGSQPMRGADDWWAMILGTGFRGTLDALTPVERALVEERVRTRLAGEAGIHTPLVLGTARKPRLHPDRMM